MQSYLFNVVTALKSDPITPNKQSSWKKIQVVVFWRISGPLEHVQHPLSNQETT